MTLRDFSLISVLYDAKEGGLYKDVYFPIIKYSLVSLFHQDETKEYYTVDVLCEFIQNNFGLTIPGIVLEKVIKTLPNNRNFEISLYSDRNSFKIQRAWDYTFNVQIDDQAFRFQQEANILENKFSEYISKVCHQEPITFLQFISDNTDDILGYLGKNDSAKVDGKYAIVADFMQYIKVAAPKLQDIANKLFWGSIIAGFLKREDPPFSSADTQEVNEYFIDTSLTMALLDLSTPLKKKYADELLTIIEKSGGVPYIHPITKLEIWKILQTVEDQSFPNPNTEIANAYERRNLTPSLLAAIRVGLTENLRKIGIEVLPTMSERELQKQVHALSKDSRVIDLSRLRTSGGADNESETNQQVSQQKYLFREIHDIYMMDYICERRKKLNRDTIRFVTLNNELIKFAKNKTGNSSDVMIHANKIIVDLWMHNSFSSKDISPLTEALTRCQLLQENDARRKLNLVSKYYNERSEFFNPHAYKAIILSLYKKARNVVRYIDEVETNETAHKTGANANLVRSACEEALKQSTELTDANNKMMEEIDRLRLDLSNKIETFQTEQKKERYKYDGISTQLRQAQSTIREKQKENEILEDKNQKQNMLLEKHKKLNELQSQKFEIITEMAALTAEMAKSVSYVKYWGQLVWIIVCTGLFWFVVVKLYLNGLSNMSIIGLLPIGTYVWMFLNGNWLSPKIYYRNVTEEQMDYLKDKNPEYKKRCIEKEKVEQSILKLQSEIEELDNL